MCDCLCALGPATDTGVTLFVEEISDRPPDEAQRVEWFPPRPAADRIRTTHVEIEGAARRHHRLRRFPAGVGVGRGARRERSRRRDRERDDLHEARSPRRTAGSHRDRSRAPRSRARAVRNGRDRDDDVAARTTRTRWLGPPRCGASVLVVVPRRRRREHVRARRRRARCGRSNGSAPRAISNRTTIATFDTARIVIPGSR